MKTNEFSINDPVRIWCPAYKNGKVCYGVITGKKNNETYYVMIRGNVKSTSFYFGWLRLVGLQALDVSAPR